MQKLSEFVSSRELFYNLTLRELRSKYKRTVLGWTWSLLNPLTNMVIYTLVFGVFLGVKPDPGVPSGLDNFTMYLLCGLLPYNFLSNGLNGGMGSLIGNGNLVKKVYFPREILVAASTASWVVSFLIELSVLSVALVFFGNIVILWLPVILLLVALETVFVLGLALMLASAAVYFRDLQHLLGLVLQMWFYTAPIVYPMSLIYDKNPAGWLLFLFNLNPLTRFVSAFQNVFFDMRFPPLDYLAYIIAVSFVTLWAGLAVFGRLQGRLAEEL